MPDDDDLMEAFDELVDIALYLLARVEYLEALHTTTPTLIRTHLYRPLKEEPHA